MRCKNKACREKLPKGTLPQVCSDECRNTVIAEAIAKSNESARRALKRAQNVKAREEKAQRAEFRRKKQEFYSNDYSHQFQLTKKAAQRLANLLDAQLPCICCDAPRGMAQFCGGHAKSSGAHPELALDLRNIHGQRNALCNQNKSGNWAGDKHSKGYRQGLIDRYGFGIVAYLESYHPPRKYSCAELIELRAVFAAEIKRLEKGLPPSRDWRKIQDQEQRLSGRSVPRSEEEAA